MDRDWDDGAYTGFGDSLWEQTEPAVWKPDHPRTARRDVHKLAKVLDGECPMPGCRGILEDFFCPVCGVTSPPSKYQEAA